MNKPKVALCIPSGDTWKGLMAYSWMGLCARSAPHAQLIPVNARTQDTAEARNYMTAAALDAGAEWLLWIDADMVFPSDGLLRLLAHDTDIVGADYRRRSPPFPRIGKPVGLPAQSGLEHVHFIGLGFLLMRAQVLRKMGRPWFVRSWNRDGGTPDNPSGFATEDAFFCGHAAHLGYKVFADLDLSDEVGHICETPIPWNLTGPQPAIAGVSCLKSSA